MPSYSKNIIVTGYYNLFRHTPELTKSMEKVNSLKDGLKDLYSDVEATPQMKLRSSEIADSDIGQSVVQMNLDYLKKVKEGPTLKEQIEEKVVESLRNNNTRRYRSSW